MQHPEVAALIQQLGLISHPEGGWYREVYRSAACIHRVHLPDRFAGNRSLGTGVYFLLTSENFSACHRIRSDEGWHFYAGDGLSVYGISLDGVLRVQKLGGRPDPGELFQSWAPAGLGSTGRAAGRW